MHVVKSSYEMSSEKSLIKKNTDEIKDPSSLVE
jgi:hypothetical protein